MQTFNAMPTDAELAVLLAPADAAYSAKVQDSPEKLVVQPAGIPLWFVLVSISVPVFAATWLFAHHIALEGIDPMFLLGLVIFCLAVPGVLGIFLALNWQITSKGDCLVVDKEQRTLALPRLGVVLRDDQITALVEVHGWHITWDGWNDAANWLVELSVLARGPNNEFAHLPILTSQGGARPVARVAQRLADFFEVERRVLKIDWKTSWANAKRGRE